MRARHIVEGYVAGLHRSPNRGFSIEFAEHREYVPGDDLRYVDWKAFARTDRFFLKQFEDETNLIAYLVLDTSASMGYRGPDAALSKWEYAQCLAAAVAWLVLRQQDAVGLTTIDHQVRTQLRPASNPTQLGQVLQVIEQAEPSDRSAVGAVFHELARRFAKRGVVLIFSDLFDDPDALLRGLSHFRHCRHDVIVFHVLDPAELDFPFDRPALFQGLEGEPSLATDTGAIRRAYQEEIQRFLLALQRGCRSRSIDYQQVRSDMPVDLVLTRYLATRMAQIK